MDINNLTIGQARELAALFGAAAPAAAPHPFIGKFVICRCVWSGVHAGVLQSKDGSDVILTDSRRLWDWRAKSGVALSGVAQKGYKSGKVDVVNPLHALTDVCEIIPCAPGVKESIDAAA